MIKFLSIAALSILLLASCSKSDTAPQAPTISLYGLSANTVRSGAIEDTLIISLQVSDPNGDLSSEDGTGKQDVILIDSRHAGSDLDTLRFNLPAIPKAVNDASKGISGRADIMICAGIYLFQRDDHLDGDTLHFDIHVLDRAGHESNVITTPDIYLTP
jgi:hypothetical protein